MPQYITNLTNIGLLVDIIGAMLMFAGAEKVNYLCVIHSDEKYAELTKKATRKNRQVKLGAMLLFIGFLLQIVGNNT